MKINGRDIDLSFANKASVTNVYRPIFTRPICSVGDAEKALTHVFKQLLGDRFQWLPEYDEVCRWFAAPNGKGLLLLGNCGTGKSLLLHYVLPVVLEAVAEKVVLYMRADEITPTNYEDLRRRRVIAIDDIGTEGRITLSGYRNDFYAVERIVEKIADNNGCMFLSTNLTPVAMLERYGERTVDRLAGICKTIEFKTQSLR